MKAKDDKDAQIAQLRGKLGQMTRMREDDRKFFGKSESESRELQMTRNSLAWLVLDAVAVMAQYRDSVSTLARAGLQAKLDAAMPGFRARVQADRDQQAEGHAKADAAEREQRAKARAAGKVEDADAD